MEFVRPLSSLRPLWLPQGSSRLISVDSVYQHKGIGSMLMQWGCDIADRNRQDAFVLASPAAVRLDFTISTLIVH